MLRRCMSTVARSVKVGKPGQLAMESAPVPSPAGSQVVVQMLAAPISEYDTAVITGRLGAFNGIAGNEGVGVVKTVGSSVSGVKVNDWVVPSAAGLGTFSEYVVADATDVQVVPNDINVNTAAMIGGTGSTALRLLSDYGKNTCIVQNAANGPVGQAVVQIAKARGMKTINIIPDGPDSDAVVEHLYSLGADIVVTESYSASAKFGKLIKDLPPPSLGINGAGGNAATSVARAVAEGATVVTYGGSAAVTVPTSVLVNKGLSLAGFSLPRWNAKASAAARADMTKEVVALVEDGALKASVDTTPFADIFSALETFSARSSQSVTTPLVTM